MNFDTGQHSLLLDRRQPRVGFLTKKSSQLFLLARELFAALPVITLQCLGFEALYHRLVVHVRGYKFGHFEGY